MHKRKRVLVAVVFGLLVNALAALLCDIAEGFTHAYMKDLSLAGFLLCALPALIVPCLYLLFFYLGPKEFRGNKYLSFTLAAVMAVLSLGAQLWAYLQLATDAQAALAFLFLPIYAGFAYAAFGFVLVGLTVLLRTRTPTPAPPPMVDKF